MTVIIYGPMACGKTRNRQALAARFGCSVIVDDWLEREHVIVPGALHLTNQRPRREEYREFENIRFDASADAKARVETGRCKRWGGAPGRR